MIFVVGADYTNYLLQMRHTVTQGFVILILASSLYAGSPASDGKAPVSPIADEAWGGTLLGGGIKTNANFTEGSLFLTQPLLLNTIGKNGRMEGSLLFIEPYGTWGEQGDLGASLGLGFRHLFSNQTVQDARTNQHPGLFGEGFFVGGSFFVDYDQTGAGSDFWQLGAGAEAGTRYFEVHANFYIPQSDSHTLSRHTDTFTRSSTRRSTRTNTGGAFVTANGSTVQNVVRTNYQTTRTVTTRRTLELFEEPLDGWDLELSARVPGIEKWCDVRLIGGYYDYQGDRSQAPDFAGWRAGVEVRPLRGVVLSATWFEKSQLYRDNWLVGLRLEIPLGAKSHGTFSSGYRHLADSLYEPVHRKNSAITTSGVQQVTLTNTSTGQTTVVSQTTTQNVISTPPPPSDGEQNPD